MTASEEFDPETAVMDALPHALHPMHDNWRAKAAALIAGLAARGYRITFDGLTIDPPPLRRDDGETPLTRSLGRMNDRLESYGLIDPDPSVGSSTEARKDSSDE